MAWSLNGVAGMTEKPLLSVPRGRTVVVDFRNDTRWPHAMHFHGHHFKVLERDGKPTEHETWKDTVLIDPQKAAKIAFVADNPGKWMIHCHMLEHQASGMSSWFVRSEEHTSELQSLMRISYAVFCLKKKTKSNKQ